MLLNVRLYTIPYDTVHKSFFCHHLYIPWLSSSSLSFSRYPTYSKAHSLAIAATCQRNKSSWKWEEENCWTTLQSIFSSCCSQKWNFRDLFVDACSGGEGRKLYRKIQNAIWQTKVEKWLERHIKKLCNNISSIIFFGSIFFLCYLDIFA